MEQTRLSICDRQELRGKVLTIHSKATDKTYVMKIENVVPSVAFTYKVTGTPIQENKETTFVDGKTLKELLETGHTFVERWTSNSKLTIEYHLD